MTHRTAARVVGALFIIASVPFTLAVVLLEPILAAPDYLIEVSRNEFRVGTGALLELTNHIAVVGIAVVIYPVLRPFSERLAMGYLVARSMESVIFIMGTMHLVALLNVSHEFVAAGAPPVSHFHTLGSMLLTGHDWNRAEFAFTAFSLSALILNYLLFQARLVPRWLCGWGMFGAALLLAARIMVISGLELSSATVTLLDSPIMVQEMVFAVWLIVKGFNSGAFTEGREPGV
jgi:hypothetical protein